MSICVEEGIEGRKRRRGHRTSLAEYPSVTKDTLLANSPYVISDTRDSSSLQAL